MGCPITLAGITLDCKGLGGLSELYIFDNSVFTSVQITPSLGVDILDTLVLTALSKMYKYELVPETSGMVSTITNNKAAGTSFVSTDLNLVFNKMTPAKRMEIQALVIGNVKCIVKDKNNNYWYLGYDNPVEVTGGTAVTGVALGDANQYTLTLNDLSAKLPYPFDGSEIVDWL